MVPLLATIVCVALIGYLFRKDLQKREREHISWAPFAWMFFAGSRFASAWLDLRAPGGGVDAYAEGSPVDRAVFLLLIVWGATILYRRNIQWRQLFMHNKWLVAYFIYCLISVMWTDEPQILAKRWVKDLGNPIMALVMLTESRSYDAIVTTVRRLAFVLLPLSVLFIRYYPEFGRGYSIGGGVMYTGVSDQKNTLGMLCLIIGICYGWTFLHRRESVEGYQLALAATVAWLLYMSNSKTSSMCLIVALGILACSKVPFVGRRPTRIITVTVCVIALYLTADALFHVQDYLLGWLGRDATLTNRTEVWAVVSALQTNAMVGTGFMSFWAGDRMGSVWATLGPGINQAHNGYLEQYLNLGYVGVAFIIAIAASALLNVRGRLETNRSVAIFRLCLIVTAMLYNYTEASFYGMNNMWVLLLAASIDPAGAGSVKSVGVFGASDETSTSRHVAGRRHRSLAAVGRSADGVGVRLTARPHLDRVPALTVKRRQITH